jgi:hypothetical protein
LACKLQAGSEKKKKAGVDRIDAHVIWKPILGANLMAFDDMI